MGATLFSDKPSSFSLGPGLDLMGTDVFPRQIRTIIITKLKCAVHVVMIPSKHRHRLALEMSRGPILLGKAVSP